jgi:hypothetical protein
MRGKKGRRLDAFISAMLTAKTTEDAARRAQIGVATAYRWLADHAIARRLAEARKEAMARCMTRIQQAANQSIDTLCHIQTSGESESARVTAARIILEMALHTVELQSLQERVDALEARAKGGNSAYAAGENQTPGRSPGGVNGHA